MTEDPESVSARGQDLFGLGEQERRALLAWVGENLPQVRRSDSGQRILYWSLTRRRSARRPEPEATRRRGTTKRRRRVSRGSQRLGFAGAEQRAAQVQERGQDVGAARS
jgi:hypothetical protein